MEKIIKKALYVFRFFLNYFLEAAEDWGWGKLGDQGNQGLMIQKQVMQTSGNKRWRYC